MLTTLIAFFRRAFSRPGPAPFIPPPPPPAFSAIVPPPPAYCPPPKATPATPTTNVADAAYVESFGETIPPLKRPPPKLHVVKATDWSETDEHGVLDVSGRFVFKDRVLDRLDKYMRAMKHMKSAYPEAYDACRRIGVNLVPDRVGIVFKETLKEDGCLPPWFVQTLPAFGAIAMDAETDHHDGQDWIWPRVFHFMRYEDRKHPPMVAAPRQGKVYLLTAFFDDHREFGGKGLKHSVDLPVAVMPDGALIPCPILEQRSYKIRHKKWRAGEPRESHIRRGEWGMPSHAVYWASDHKSTAPSLMRCLFRLVASLHTHTNSSMIRVGVTKGDVTALMNVDITRTPYFFKDREPVVVDGVTKRIFHIVRIHTRANGQVVPLHFRGLRNFVWNGYDVAITVPGVDHAHIAEIPVAGLDYPSHGPIPKGMVPLPVFADRVAKMIENRNWQ
jgi:hypothetical protein